MMTSTSSTNQLRTSTLLGRKSTQAFARPPARISNRVSLRVRATEDRDSYQKLEAPVRTEFPEGVQVGPDVKDRQTEADAIFKSDAANPDRQLFNSDVGFLEMMRFKGALPEVLNSRLAMLGFAWGVIAERVQNKDLFTQVQSSPALIAAVVALITVASAVPFYKGVRRSGNPIFTADAELWNGRLAMIGIVIMIINTAVKGRIF